MMNSHARIFKHETVESASFQSGNFRHSIPCSLYVWKVGQVVFSGTSPIYGLKRKFLNLKPMSCSTWRRTGPQFKAEISLVLLRVFPPFFPRDFRGSSRNNPKWYDNPLLLFGFTQPHLCDAPFCDVSRNGCAILHKTNEKLRYDRYKYRAI